MEIIERHHEHAPSSRTDVERLRAQNAILLAAIASASAAMTAAPNWHEMHRSADKVLRVALSEVGANAKAQVPPARIA